ncbi:hypothetical protein VTI74DRAFT_1083 [Chaetomium olivicolor]
MSRQNRPLDTRITTPRPVNPSIPPDIQELFKSALDDGPYKTWKDASGKLFPTSGALLPQGYQQSNDPDFPWLCPVRSCSRLLPSLAGLGKHFCNAHRASLFNDNLDGTLTDLGTYADPAQGNGKNIRRLRQTSTDCLQEVDELGRVAHDRDKPPPQSVASETDGAAGGVLRIEP